MYEHQNKSCFTCKKYNKCKSKYKNDYRYNTLELTCFTDYGEGKKKWNLQIWD